ncbi:MAG: heme exporter protein CcmD [Dokdonella sp.]|uniref:heme exporter protein CcmD n=1 Tax=Dokdonella sp. TaxID=2291710 RepID=UPI003262E495
MKEFLAMGGYGAYVWPSYAIFFIVLALEALAPLAQRKRLLADIRGRLKRREAREDRT